MGLEKFYLTTQTSRFHIEAIEQNKPVDAINADFEKEFDRGDHDILLRKHFKGGRGRLLILIQSYLRNRPQRVKVDISLSRCFLASSGEPQGAIPATLFYLVFINDEPEVCVDIGSFQNDFNYIFHGLYIIEPHSTQINVTKRHSEEQHLPITVELSQLWV